MRTTNFIPKHQGTLYTGVSYTDTGDELPANPVRMRFSVVRIRTATRDTSIRTDKSGSQSRAEETFYDGRILVYPDITPENDQVVSVLGVTYRINEVQPKFDALGNLNHYQVDLTL